jgi:drug/metabolite transporter (DMT)-like permease
MERMTTAPAGGVDRIALGAALVTVVLWASAFVGIRAAGADFEPGSLALGRLLVASIALTLLVAARRPSLPSRRALIPIVASGILWFGVYNVALNTAEREVDAGTAAMLVNIGPILIAILGGLFLGEGFPPRLLIGCLIAFGGAVVIGLATSGPSPTSAGLIGIVLCLVAAAVWAVSVSLQKPVLRHVPALTVTWLACLVGTLVCLPFAPQLLSELRVAGPAGLGWLAYLGVFPTAIAFTTWAFALNRTTAGRLGSTTYLVPAMAIGLGWLLLGEAPAQLALVGGAIAIVGVVVARSRPRTSAAVAKPLAEPLAEPMADAPGRSRGG